MSTAAELRFLFDHDFAAPDVAPAPEPEEAFEPSVDEERLAREAEMARAVAEADAAGFARGRAEAEAEIAAREDARMNALLERLDRQFLGVLGEVSAQMRTIEAQGAEAGITAARMLAPALVASAPETEIAAFFARAAKDFLDVPRLDVALNPADVEAAGGLLTKLARASGFEGQMRVRADEAVGIGDCALRWGEGGVRRDRAKLDAELAALVAEHFAPAPDA